ncbi:MAG: hypothetical protein WAK40_00360 [Thermoplasmata archaeon]
MTTVRPDAGAHPRLRSTLPGVAAVVILLVLLAFPSALAASASATPPPFVPSSWNNEVVVCTFDPTDPSATIGANGTSESGMWMGMGSLTATGVAGAITETASLSGATWTALNLSTAGLYSLAYTSNVPVVSVLDLPLGTTNVTIIFSLPDSNSSTAVQNETVTTTLSVVGWPLAVLSSNLTAELDFRPANASAEHLEGPVTGGSAIESIGNASGIANAYLNLSKTAVVSTASGILSTIPVVSGLLGLTPDSGTLAVSFATPPSTAMSVNYTTAMQVVPPQQPVHPIVPPLPGHVPTADFLAAAGAAVLASLAIAGATRRVRRSPSDLEYVEEES